MNVSRDPDRMIRAFLDEGRTELPDRVYDAVRGEIEHTSQRVVLGPWRFPDMQLLSRLAFAAAALVVVAIVSINILPRGIDAPGGGPAASAPIAGDTPSPTASPTRAPRTPAPSIEPLWNVPLAPTAQPGAFPAAGALEPGRYAFSQGGVRFSLELAQTGWRTNGVEVPPDGGSLGFAAPEATAGIWMVLMSIDGVFEDPCGHVPALPVGPSAGELAEAIAGIPGLETTEPSDVTVGGQPAKLVVVRVPQSLDCEPRDFFLWYNNVRCGSEGPCERWASALGSTIRVWIVDANSTRVWIEAESYEGAGPDVEQQIQDVIDSIQFG